jgi:hypothetical protein
VLTAILSLLRQLQQLLACSVGSPAHGAVVQRCHFVRCAGYNTLFLYLLVVTHVCNTHLATAPLLPPATVTYEDNNSQQQMHLYQEEYKFSAEDNAGMVYTHGPCNDHTGTRLCLLWHSAGLVLPALSAMGFALVHTHGLYHWSAQGACLALHGNWSVGARTGRVGKGSGLFTFKQRQRGVLPIHVVPRKLLLITVLV